MANITASFGLKYGILVLAGDVGKTILACLLCRYIVFPQLGVLGIYYAGFGTILGHNFPFWHHFSGGKGVAVTCMFLFLASPLWGLLAVITGGVVVLITEYLAAGAVVIPAAFIIAAFLLHGSEAGLVIILTTVMMLYRHFPALKLIMEGRGEKTKLIKKT